MGMAAVHFGQTDVSVDMVVSGAVKARSLTETKIAGIRAVTGRLRILALNAMIEANQAGDHGRGFAVVAQEVRAISAEVEALSGDFSTELIREIARLEETARRMATAAQGRRLIDLALNAVELIDRNLYERSCDVRWWATDSAMIDALARPGSETAAFAAHRLGVILDAYTVYLDLWLCDPSGQIVASGRPGRFPVAGQSAAGRPWFTAARGLADGNDYAVADISSEPLLGGAHVATYAAGVREGGDPRGRLIGILGIQFDWAPQARAIVEGVRLTEDERARSRVLLVDADRRVIAASDGQGILRDCIDLPAGQEAGSLFAPDGTLVAFHHTPGYETYRGLGWYGVIQQRP